MERELYGTAVVILTFFVHEETGSACMYHESCCIKHDGTLIFQVRELYGALLEKNEKHCEIRCGKNVHRVHVIQASVIESAFL